MFGIDDMRCVGCGLCLDVCPKGAIRLLDGMASIEQGRCNGCGACVDVCPVGAIRQLVPQGRASTFQTPSFAPLLAPAMLMPAPFGRWSSGRCRRRRGWRD